MRKALMLAAASVMVLSACGQGERYSSSDEDVVHGSIESVPAREGTRLLQATVQPQSRQPGIAPAPVEPLQARVATPTAANSIPEPRFQAAAPAPATAANVAPALPMVDQTFTSSRPERTAPPPSLAPLAPVAKIAYAFSYVMSAPKDRGAELMSKHEFACASAGPGLCQVVSGNADWTSRQPGGRLELRGQPEWINRFRASLAADARNAGGRVERTTTEGEDVTGGIDVATTGSQTTATIADRIKDLQRRKGGTLAEQMNIEAQLANLQRQLDTQQIELREMNDRVLSARLTIDYRQAGVMAADSATRPVAVALQNAYGVMMVVLAMLITLGSVLLPIGLIGGAVWWGARRRRKPVAIAA